MNACPGPDGSMLLSESNGLVKQFAADGTLVEILASANVQSGCKNSSIGLSTDGATLYYLDINRGRVLVLEKKS
jgi:sugar lactone lactonase YvrE